MWGRGIPLGLIHTLSQGEQGLGTPKLRGTSLFHTHTHTHTPFDLDQPSSERWRGTCFYGLVTPYSRGVPQCSWFFGTPTYAHMVWQGTIKFCMVIKLGENFYRVIHAHALGGGVSGCNNFFVIQMPKSLWYLTFFLIF